MQLTPLKNEPWMLEVLNKALERGRLNIYDDGLRVSLQRSYATHPEIKSHRDDHKGTYTVCILESKALSGIGVAKLKPSDQDNPRTGETIALMRALENLRRK